MAGDALIVTVGFFNHGADFFICERQLARRSAAPQTFAIQEDFDDFHAMVVLIANNLAQFPGAIANLAQAATGIDVT